MGTLARLLGIQPATKAAVPNISEDGTFSVVPGWWGMNWALPGKAGITVTPDSALGIVSVYACVRVIAESVASLPLRVYRRLPDGGKERADDHQLYRVLHDAPNPEMTSFVWRETVLSHLLTWGNSYNEIVLDNTGRLELWPLNPARVEVKWEAGRRQYDYLATSGRKRLRTGSVFHIPGLSSNGLVGFSPITVHREALGLYQALENFGSSFMRNQARPGFALLHPGNLSLGAQERLAVQVDGMRGSANAGKTVVLEEGISLKEIGVPPEDAQYIEARKFQREEVASMFRVPPHLIGDLSRSTNNNIEHQSLEFVMHTLRPWLVRIEQEIKAQLMDGDEDFFPEFLVDGLLRGDALGRAQSLAVQLEHGVITENEWRAIENRNPWEVDRRWTPIANHNAALIDAGGNPVEVTQQEPVAEEPAEEETFPPLRRVKSVKDRRCTGRLASGEVCDKYLAEVAPSGWRATCPRCKTVNEELLSDEPDHPPPILTIVGTKYEYDTEGRIAAVLDITA